MAHDVFISYATEDKAFADATCATLEQQGIRCWIAPRDIRPGADWGESILDGIKHARLFVLVFSARANASAHISREVERAVSHDIPVIPVRIEDVIPQGSLEYNLATVHWLDALTPPVEAHIRLLADTLRATLRGDSRPLVHTPPPVPLPRDQTAVARPAWLKPAAISSVVLILVVIGYFAFRDPSPPDAGRSSAPAPAPVESGSPPPPARNASGAPVSDAQRAAFKQAALKEQKWFTCDAAFCSFTTLRSFFPAVTRVRFGESASQLDRTIELPPLPSTLDQRQAQQMSERYAVQNLPIRPASRELYARLEFYDGTKSEVRPAQLETDTKRMAGIRVDAAAPPGARAPALFVGYTVGADRFEIMPDAPQNAAAVMYAFDDGAFQRARPLGSGTRVTRAFQFESPVADASVRLRFVLADGTEQGPMLYDLRAEPLILDAFKAGFATDLDNTIDCTRIAFTLPLPDADSASGPDRAAATRAANAARSLLGSKNLSFVKSAPVVACVPSRQRGRSDFGDWAAVREVRVGVAPGRMDQSQPVDADWHAALARKLPAWQEGYRVWHAFVPENAGAVYVQFVYRDGSTSREIRVPVEEIRLR